MAIPLPDLDDRRYDDLVSEIVSLIPRYSSDWTDHNASDPGIMLIELFAWLFEALMYRQNRITEKSSRTFLKLLNGGIDADYIINHLSLKQAEAVAAENIRKMYRAVTSEDFESLVLGMKKPVIARAKCLPGLNLEGENPQKISDGHVSLVVVPSPGEVHTNRPMPSVEDLVKVYEYLEPRRLITTRLHVVPPVYISVCLDITVSAVPGQSLSQLEFRVRHELENFFNPLSGWIGGKGWPFGRPVYSSEIYQLVESVPGVDHVEKLVLFKKEKESFTDSGAMIPIGPDALPDYESRNHFNKIRITGSYG